MTIIMLMKNTVKSAKNLLKIQRDI